MVTKPAWLFASVPGRPWGQQVWPERAGAPAAVWEASALAYLTSSFPVSPMVG